MSDRSDDQDEDDEDEDDEGPVDEYDAEYFGDAKDRAELMAMSEVDREQILFERAKKVKGKRVVVLRSNINICDICIAQKKAF